MSGRLPDGGATGVHAPFFWLKGGVIPRKLPMGNEQELIAIANLIEIAMADGVLSGNDLRLLEAYVDAFDVSETNIEKIVQVIASKNDKSKFF